MKDFSKYSPLDTSNAVCETDEFYTDDNRWVVVGTAWPWVLGRKWGPDLRPMRRKTNCILNSSSTPLRTVPGEKLVRLPDVSTTGPEDQVRELGLTVGDTIISLRGNIEVHLTLRHAGVRECVWSYRHRHSQPGDPPRDYNSAGECSFGDLRGRDWYKVVPTGDDTPIQKPLSEKHTCETPSEDLCVGGLYNTRGGAAARVIVTDRKSFNNKPVLALVTLSSGVENVFEYTLRGWFMSACEPHNMDLMVVSKEHIARQEVLKYLREHGHRPEDFSYAMCRQGTSMAYYRVPQRCKQSLHGWKVCLNLPVSPRFLQELVYITL